MVKKIVLVILVLMVVLAGVVVARALRLPSRQITTDLGPPVDIRVDADSAARHLAGAIRFPTISHENVEDTDTASFRALQRYFEETYPLVHQTLKKELVSGLSLLYTWEGLDPDLEPVVLMGHQDVVPVIPGTEQDWEHGAFSGDIADGYVWGRGSMDDKVSVVSILEAVEALLADGFQPRRTIYLAFGHDEEVGGVRGASFIARTLGERGAEPYAFVVDEGGAVIRGMIPGIDAPVALVGIAEKGYVNTQLEVEGEGGHSSTPPDHTNIGILADAVTELEEDPFPAHFGGAARQMFDYLAPEMSFGPRAVFANLWLFRPLVTHMLLRSPETASMLRTTTAVTIIGGGVKANVLPISARAVVNHRILPGETVESVVARDQTTIEDERVQVSRYGEDSVDPSPVSDPESPAFRMLARTVRQVMRNESVVVAPYLVMGGTDAKYYSGRSRNVYRFLAAPMEADALHRAHGTNERMTVDGLATSIRFFEQLIRNSDSLGS